MLKNPHPFGSSRCHSIKMDGYKMKLILRILLVLLFGLICGILSMIVGAWIGGNYAVDFVFLGVRGYEATGLLSLIVGFIGGSALGWVVVFKLLKK